MPTNPESLSLRPWSRAAATAQDVLDGAFWDPSRGIYHNVFPANVVADEPFHYWWQAHGLDVAVDAFERTRDPRHGVRAARLVDGLLARNGGHLFNDFYDDMAWMALALLRAHHAFGDERFLSLSRSLWTRIREGWSNVQGGGIAWRSSQPDYKNAPANAPAAMLAARHYRHGGDPEDLSWCHRIFDWLQETLIDSQTGFVWDGINRKDDGEIDRAWRFTYNQGVGIGAALELHQITGDEAYRSLASRIAATALTELRNPETGLFPDEGGGDGGLFKGILARYLGTLVRHRPDEDAVRACLLENAARLMDATGQRSLFGTNWAAEPGSVVELSSQLSGVMLLEQAAMVDGAAAAAEAPE